MVLYHGSNTGNIKVLKPNQADHDRPYVYMTTLDVVAENIVKNRDWNALFALDENGDFSRVILYFKFNAVGILIRKGSI